MIENTQTTTKLENTSNGEFLSFNDFKGIIITDERIRALSYDRELTYNICHTSSGTYEGLCVHLPEEKAGPVFNLNAGYDLYMKSGSLDVVVNDFIGKFNANPAFDVSELVSKMFDKKWLLSHLYCRLLPKTRDSEELVTQDWLDLIIDLYIDPEKELLNGINGSIRLTYNTLKSAHIDDMTIDELVKIAMDNTAKLSYVDSLFNSLKNLYDMKESSDYLGATEGYSYLNPLILFTSNNKTNGSAMFLANKQALKQCALEHDNRKVAILPSSVHETLVIAIQDDDGDEISDFLNMTREVNSECVSPDDFLSDNIYIYDPVNDSFSVVS